MRSALSKRIKEKVTTEKQLKRHADKVKSLLTSFDFHSLTKSISQNIRQLETSIVNTHKKKLQNLTRNAILPFTSSDVITNLSKYHLSAEESSILKYGLSYAIPPKFISKTEVFTSFEMINRFLQSEVKSEELKAPLKAELAHLAHTYYSLYRAL